MNRDERLMIFKRYLRTTVTEKPSGGFVIFDAGRDKFVQFAGNREVGLVCDIPLVELSKDEEKRLLALEEFATHEGATDANTGEQISYQTPYDEEDIDKAAVLTERIFIEVLRFPKNYAVVEVWVMRKMTFDSSFLPQTYAKCAPAIVSQ